MANTYNYLKNAFLELKQENRNHSSFIFIIFALLSIPLSYSFNSIALGLLVFVTVFFFKKENVTFNLSLFLPLLLYILMALSFFWSIDQERTLKALSKELPLLLIPLCFLAFKTLTTEQKNKILKYYSYGILIFAVVYLLTAVVRFVVTKDTNVFFYHELVTKDVNAIHVSVYVAIAFFYFYIKSIRSLWDVFAMILLFGMVFLLSSKNIIVVFIGLMICYHLFFSKISKRMRLKNLILLIIFLFSLAFIGKVRDRFKQEYETIMTDSSVNDVISKDNSGIVYNVSIKQAWTNETFKPNDYFPGTAFRVYQFRIFLEMLQEDPIFLKGYGLNASYSKIEEKGIHYNVFLGNESQEGYQKKNFHNQYVQTFAELGVFGFIILLGILFLNLKNAIETKDFLHISFAVLMISLFLTESFLWRQRGIMFFTLMYCLFNSNIRVIATKK